MNPFETKAIFLWNVPAVKNGDPQAIADILKAGGFGAVWVKAAQSSYIFRPSIFAFPFWLNKPNIDKNFVDVMHSNDIAVAGWTFCETGGDAEGKTAADLVNSLGLDGYIWDVESKLESYSDRVARMGQTQGTFRKTAHVPTGYCSWAWHWARVSGTQIHAVDLPMFAMSIADYGIPMCYWSRLDANSKPLPMDDLQVVSDLDKVLEQWERLSDKPTIPTGRAYTGDGNIVTPSNVSAFASAVTSRTSGVSWWSLEHALSLPDVWAELVKSENPSAPPVEPEPEYSVSVGNVSYQADRIVIDQTITAGPVKFDWIVTIPPAPPVTPPEPPAPEPTIKPRGTLYKVIFYPGWSQYHIGNVPPEGGPVTIYCTRPRDNGRIVKGDNRMSLPAGWEPYIRSLQTDPKAYGKIIAPDYGPTFGGLGKWLGLIYPGNPSGELVNQVSVLKTEYNDGDTWALIEAFDPNKPPALDYTRKAAPWLVHEVFGSGNKQVTAAPTRCYVPIPGGFYSAEFGCWAWWTPAALLQKA